MRILQVPPGYPPMLGGVENSVYELTKHLRSSGNEVTVVTCDPERVGFKSGVWRLRPHIKLQGDWGEIYFSPLIFKALKKLQYDVVHAHTPRKLPAESVAAFKLLRKRNMPFIVSIRLINVSLPSLLRGISDTYRKTIERMMFHLADKIAVQTLSNRRLLIEQCGVNQDKIVIIPNGVDTETFDPGTVPLLAKHSEVEGKHVIISAGRLTSQKGFEYLIKALPSIKAELSDVVIAFAGSGPLKESLVRLARDLGVDDSVMFIGNVSHDEMPAFLASGDVFVLPSLSESFPNIMLEAMAMQRAMVATRVGVIPETLEDGYTASLVNPGNPHELSKSILALLSDDSLRRKMGYNARDLVEKEYSWDVVASKTLKIYEEILEQKN